MEEQKRAKEYASSALASNAEIKEQRIEEAARRKVVGDVMRAEASRLRFKKKRLRADRRVQVRIRSSSLPRLHSARPFAVPAAVVASWSPSTS